MKKNTFLKSTIILIIGSAITKALGMLIKIIMNRIIGIEGISLYMLIFPTFSLFMTISQLGFPIAISKLVAEDKYNNKKLVLSTIPISLILNILLIVIIVLIAPFLANNLLKEKEALYPILAIALVLPFDSISSILRGYFFGKERMIPHIISLVIEQIVRLILIVIISPILIKKSITLAVVGLVLVNMISELSSIIFLIFMMPNKKIRKQEIIPNLTNIKNVLSISLPTTGSRLIGNICYFFEPIIITYCLTLNGYNTNFIITEYGIIEGFVLPLLILPNFFTNAISNALIPYISKKYSENNIKEVKKKLKQVIIISLLIGVPLTLILLINPVFFLYKIYNTTKGIEYVKFLSLFFIILYIQSPLASILQAINKPKNIMYHNLIGTITKLVLIFILSFFKIGLYNFLIGMISNIIIVTFLHYKTLKKELNKNIL